MTHISHTKTQTRRLILIAAALALASPAAMAAVTVTGASVNPNHIPAPLAGASAKPNAVIATCVPERIPGPSPLPIQKTPQTLQLRCVPHTLHVAGVVLNAKAAAALMSGGKAGIRVVPYVHQTTAK